MSNSVIYMANTTQQSVVVDSVVNFGNIVRKYGCSLSESDGNVIIKNTGYYSIETNFTFVPSADGTLIITLYKDGIAIPGAETIGTVATSSTYSFTIPAIIRNMCCCESTITAKISGVSGVISNASIAVEKL